LAGDISLSTLLINIILSAYFVVGNDSRGTKLLLEFGERYRDTRRMFRCSSPING